MEFVVGDDPERAAELGAQRIAALARAAIAARGRFAIALTGGEGPKPLYRALAVRPGIEWRRWDVFFGDERAVSVEDARSNFRQADEILLSQVGVQSERVHPMFGLGMDLDAAAADYEKTLVETLGSPPVFDLILLGIGKDGHTLSLHPGCAAIDERGRFVVAIPDPPMDPRVDRISFTPPVVHAARAVMVVANGAAKALPVRNAAQARDDRQKVPAQLVRDATGDVTFLLDADAAAQVER